MKHLWNSRFFRRTMLSYLAILSVPIVILCALLVRQFYLADEARSAEACDAAAGAVDARLLDLNLFGNRLMATDWLQRARSSSPILFDDYFDPLRRQDVCRELSAYQALSGIVSEAAVLLPQRNLLITQSSWQQPERYLRYRGYSEAEIARFLDEARRPAGFRLISLDGPEGNILAAFQSLDTLEQPRAVLCLIIRGETLAAFLGKDAAGTVRFSILSGDETLYCWAAPGEPGGYSRVVPSKISPLRFAVTQRPPDGVDRVGRLALLLLTAAGTGALGAALSWLLAAVSYRPIRALAEKTGSGTREPELAAIERAFEALTGEREKLIRLLGQYHDAARGELLGKLLQGLFDEERERAALNELLPNYRDGLWYQVVVLSLPEGAAPEQQALLFLNAKAFLLSRGRPAELLERFGDTTVLIYRFSENPGQAVDSEMELLSRHLAGKLPRSPMLLPGTPERDRIGISKSYQNAKERRFLQSLADTPEGIAYYYPTDWEIQLVNQLKVGNADSAQKILAELRRENETRPLSQRQRVRLLSLVFETFLRVIGELNLDVDRPAEEFRKNLQQYGDDKLWKFFAELTKRVCGRTAESRPGGSPGNRVLSFLEENYADPALSLQRMADQFQLSTATISRIFKNIIRINFYDYLCRIRMEQAKSLFQNGISSVSEVATRVGYESALSFSRAFFRYEGVKPSQYLASLRDFSQN